MILIGFWALATLVQVTRAPLLTTLPERAMVNTCSLRHQLQDGKATKPGCSVNASLQPVAVDTASGSGITCMVRVLAPLMWW